MNGIYLKKLVESRGAERATKILKDCLHKGELAPKEFHIKELWESFVGPCGQTLAHAQRGSGVINVAEAAVDTTAFANITGEVLMQRAMDAYERPEYVGDSLYDTIQSNQRQERIPGFTLQDETDEVEEAEPYPEAGIGDKYVDVESGKKRGLILKITEEAVYFDETGQLLRIAGQIGRFIRLNREKRQLDVFTGNGPDSAYQPSGENTDIYSADNGNLISDNELTDWNDVDTAMQTLGAQEDENGNKIMVQPRVMVGPLALRSTMLQIIQAMQTTQITNSDATETTGDNPIPDILGGTPQVINSPYLDDLDDGDEWYLGEPTQAFIYREHWPFQSFRRRGDDTKEAFERDVVEQFKFREWGSPHCVDHRYVLKNAVS